MSSIPSKNLNTNNNVWNQSLLFLAGGKKPSQSLLKLVEGGVKTLLDLVYIFPLRIQKAPELSPFSTSQLDQLFLGRGKVISLNFTPAYGKKGKGKVQLFNATCVIQDTMGPETLTLKWFNTYPSLKKQLETLNEFSFLGTISEFRGMLQIVNPQINPTPRNEKNNLIIEYPTVATVAGNRIKALIEKIPEYIWSSTIETTGEESQELNLNNAFKYIHAIDDFDTELIHKAKQRLIYHEFFINQLRVLARKLKNQKLKAPILKIDNDKLTEYKRLFPYSLTEDQSLVLEHIRSDFSSGKPMMRMIQGDVGCGKTTVAILASLIAEHNGGQIAFMCPTEALATQHAETLKSVLKDKIRIELLLGSTKPKEKKVIYEQLAAGEIDLILGTHSLFQDSVIFKDLQLCIIDEQHKFGVEQRQKLVSKGKGAHSLIMTATPIPRTLQLSQYGDLEISTIRTVPHGRKGTKTRIVTAETYEKYLSFLKTRLSMGEQIYIVVPAIEESESLNLKNINSTFKIYKKFFPEFKISILHGQLSAQEKQTIMSAYTSGKIDILISTTVIEVGINVLNSTVISIYNPDRFGLSSLHQLRGRVGRGDKPGFCFLVTDQNTNQESMNRLKVIERTTDGFEIAEADLKTRGQGDLFGSSQSGHISSYRVGNIFDDFNIFEQVTRDLNALREKKPEMINNLLLDLIEDQKVSSTI